VLVIGRQLEMGRKDGPPLAAAEHLGTVPASSQCWQRADTASGLACRASTASRLLGAHPVPGTDDRAGLYRRHRHGEACWSPPQRANAAGDVFGDRIIAAAILDRLQNHAMTLNIRCNSYRLKEKLGPTAPHLTFERSRAPRLRPRCLRLPSNLLILASTTRLDGATGSIRDKAKRMDVENRAKKASKFSPCEPVQAPEDTVVRISNKGARKRRRNTCPLALGHCPARPLHQAKHLFNNDHDERDEDFFCQRHISKQCACNNDAAKIAPGGESY